MTVYGVIVTIIAVLAIGLAVGYRRERVHFRRNIDEWEAELIRLKGASHNFLTSCRLIAIHRSGRLNVFTFARDNKIFMIETMGMLSDTPQTWREQAGLIE